MNDDTEYENNNFYKNPLLTLSNSNFISKVFLEKHNPSYNKVHKLQGMIQLQTLNNMGLNNSLVYSDVEIVMIVDYVEYTPFDKKSFIMKFMNEILSRFDENFSVSVIISGEKPIISCDSMKCNHVTINYLLDNISSTKLYPYDNSSDCWNYNLNGLIEGICILNKNNKYYDKKSQHLILLTDSITKCDNILCNISKLGFPSNLNFIITGYGKYHNSIFMRELALKKHGMYIYFSSNFEDNIEINSYLTNFSVIKSDNFVIGIRGYPGSRIIALVTPHKIIEKNLAKEYIINIGHISQEFPKTILFSLSLNKLPNPGTYPIIEINIKNNSGYESSNMYINRTLKNDKSHPPYGLVIQQIRYCAAIGLAQIAELITNGKYEDSILLIGELIRDINTSLCRNDSNYILKIIENTSELITNGEKINKQIHYLNHMFCVLIYEKIFI